MIIPSFIEVITEMAFVSCSRLISVEFELHGILQRIEKGAFMFTSLSEIVFPNSLRSVSGGAFENKQV
jgi:hypothetical protein